jgi:hypothetical protein
MNEIAARLATRLFDQKLIQNQYRSAFIEAMIEPQLVPKGWRYTGDGWSGWDFERSDGARLEIKQSAAHQTWSASRNVKTRGAFDISARTGYWSEGGSKWTAAPGRCAQIYVFAWNPTTGEETDHRDPAQWQFYVSPASRLPEGQRTISIAGIQRLAAAVPLDRLCETVERVLAECR